MLERLAAWFLNTYVADYVGNVDTDQLSIGLMKGAVELENLPLKKDALRKLKLPFDIKSGYIGKLELQIPVRYIKSQPWVIQIDKLYIVAGPAKYHPGSPEEEDEAAQSRKEAKLNKLEEQWKVEQEKSSSWWYWSPISLTFPSNVIANLQVIVNDVHIRYEDDEADPNHPFSIGMLLENFSAQSTDQYWEPKFLTGEDMAWKLMDLQNFSVYFDHELLGDLEGPKLVEAFLRKKSEVSVQHHPMTVSTLKGLVPSVESVIKPVCGQARLTRNCSKVPLRINDGPRLHLDVQLEEIPVALSDNQYRLLSKLLNAFNLRARANKYKRWRPEVDSVLGNAKLWWKFALDATMYKIKKRNDRHSLKFSLHRAHQNVVYVRGYTQHLTEETIDEDVQRMLKEIEREQSFKELVVLRTIAMNHIKKERDLAEAAKRKITSSSSDQGILKNWFPGWIPGGSSSDTVTSESVIPSGSEEEDDPKKLSEEDQLLEELGYEAKDNLFLRDRIFLTMNFSLVGGSFQLVTTPSSSADSFFGPKPLVEMAFKSLNFSIDLRPRLKYGSCDLSLGSLTVTDHSHSDSLFPILVQPKGSKVGERFHHSPTFMADSSESESLFGLKIVAEEVNHLRLYQLKVYSKPLDIVYNPFTVGSVINFLTVPPEEQRSINQWKEQIQDNAHTTLRDKLGGMLGGGDKTTSHRVTSIKMDISAPHLLLPENFSGEETSVVILDLGHVTLGNVTDWSCDTVEILEQEEEDDDDDDEFQTPPSSPPNESVDGAGMTKAESSKLDALHSALHSLSALKQLELPHERYLLRLSDLQILVGKVKVQEKGIEQTGRNALHLLEKFTLSVKIQRNLKFLTENIAPTVNLSADLPSLRFHINEQMVHNLISCIQAVKKNSESIFKRNIPQVPPSSSSSSTEMSESKRESSIGASMYHSAVGSLFGNETDTTIPVSDPGLLDETLSHSDTDTDVDVSRRKSKRNVVPNLAQRLLIASEKQFSAKLTITEVMLSLSGRGRMITELNVPGINLEFIKRPHDLALRLRVQDLFLVDRIQTFGPEFELVVCSSGKSLLDSFPLSPSSSFFSTTPCFSSATPSTKLPSSDIKPSSSDLRWNPSMTSLSAELFDETQMQTTESLLALSYILAEPSSPQHPAMLDSVEADTEERGEGGEDDGGVSSGVDVENEAVIHRLNVQCTAVDTIANQETIIELIGFFQRALPDNLLPDLSGQIRHLELNPLKQKKAPLQMELSISFERLGVRMLKRVDAPPKAESTPCTYSGSENATAPVSCLIASIMLYGLAAEGKFSTDISINGRMEGVHVQDVTTIGKMYPDILVIGMRADQKEHLQSSQCLSFSINRSPQSSVSLSGSHNSNHVSDVHLAVFVPAIHYLHSVNFVYEIEMFVSEFLEYFTAMAETFKSAAVGVAVVVAKGLVRQDSQLAKGLSRIHDSLGHVPPNLCKSGVEESLKGGSGGVDEVDTGLPFQQAGNKLYFDLSVQSPIIVIPSSLSRDDCLVAHLGEITMKNEYLQQTPSQRGKSAADLDSISVPPISSPLVQHIVLNISNISLHATHTKESRLQLEDFKPNQVYPSKCCKVLKEISMVFQIDMQSSEKESKLHNESSTSNLGDENEADVLITGKVCDTLLIELPKVVFDQIKYTLKHGIRRKPKLKSRAHNAFGLNAGTNSTNQSRKNVQFNPVIQVQDVPSKGFPTICATFSLPKLSLELKHVIDDQDRNLVYISFDDLSAKYHQSSMDFLSLELSLKSIIIEDLLQPENSEYRNILASSSKPLPFPMSPVSSSKITRKISNSAGPFLRCSFPLSHLMSTPKPPHHHHHDAEESPLRSFTPSSSKKNFSSMDENESTSTIKDESFTSSETCTDLLSVKSFYVDKEHPLFEEKYDSVCLHANVDFSSVFLIINLQTWVLLLDYFGIGIPTPPSSRPSSPDHDRSFSGEEQPPKESDEPINMAAPSSVSIDESLLSDARLETGEDSLYVSSFQSLKSNNQADVLRPKSLKVQRDSSSSSPKSKYLADLSNIQEAYITSSEASASTTDSPDVEQKSSVWGVEGKLSVRVKLNVNSLTVTFNKPEFPLARGNVSSLTAEVNLIRGNMDISGALGQGSVIDMTETGKYYRERFTTTGEKALVFKIFKYGRPDPLMERPFDIQAKVQMASVRYLHTMRFLKEILAFISHFPQLIDAFQRMKAMAQGNLVYNGPERKARITFDVSIDGPILLIPKHAFSPDLIVGDIGHLKVSNSNRYDGEEGTISHMRDQKGMDCIESITGTSYGTASNLLNSQGKNSYKLSPQASTLSGASIEESFSETFSSSQFPGSLSSAWLSVTERHPLEVSERSSHQLRSDASMFSSRQDSRSSVVEEDRRRVENLLNVFRGPCLLDCIEVDLMEVDVFSAQRVPARGENFKIIRQNGNVLKEKGTAKLYIERNLYEDFCRDVPDFHIEGTLQAIHVMLDKAQLELIKGLVDMNLGETIEDFEKPSTIIRDPIAQPMAADVWTGFLFRMQFVGVQLEFLRSRETEVQGSMTQSLARFDIQESEFTFESRSNQCKTVDLKSNAVMGYDSRYEGYEDQDKPSVFTEVLRPRFNYKESKKTLQVEIHVFISPTEIRASILLNKLRLMGIFDLILELKSFIIDKLEEDIEEDDNDLDTPRPLSRMPEVRWSLRRKLASRIHLQKPKENNNPRKISVKLSVTETDFVVLEDVMSLDSNAVILKGTLILKFLSIPDKEKILNCSINGLELFSCSLSNEDETALSILDPVSITVEIKPPEVPSDAARRTNTAEGSKECVQILEVGVHQLTFRLSYNDIKLFLAIAQSLPSLESQENRENNVRIKEKQVEEELIKPLLPLGFSRADIRKEVLLSKGDLNTAALKLLAQQDEHELKFISLDDEGVDGEVKEKQKKDDDKKAFAIKSIVVHVDALSVCLIDDCVDHDVPLLDFSLADLQAEYNLLHVKKGRARAVFAGDYYNRHISAWEPVLEPWMCELSWNTVCKYSTDLDSNGSLDRTSLILSSKERLNINFTSSLIHILHSTKASWSRDLQQNGHASNRSTSSTTSSSRIISTAELLKTHQRTASGRLMVEDCDGEGGGGGGGGGEDKKISTMEKGLALLHSVRFVSQTRRRTRFVPFLLCNNTGLPLKFATLTSVPSKVYVNTPALYQKTTAGMGGGGGVVERTSEWMDVSLGSEQPFDFKTKGKMRHRDTRDLIVHQLLVKVAGWQTITIPVSVDKIGVFFREVLPSEDTDLDLITQLPTHRGPVRLVFAISLNDVQKVVNVRSALVLRNTMEIPLEVKLEPNRDASHEEYPDRTSSTDRSVSLPVLGVKGHLAVPIHLTSWNIYVRPQHWGVQYCDKHLPWKHAVGSNPTSHLRSCDAIGEETEGEPPLFRFCVSVQRQNFPPDRAFSPPQPAHTLTLSPPLTIANVLPCDIQFSVVDSRSNWSELRQRKLVQRGKEIAVHSVNTLLPFEFDVAIENFHQCQGCIVSLKKIGIPQSMLLKDCKGRSLRLTVTTEMTGGSAIKVSLSCAYWLINRTGLPLIFKQEGTTSDAAAGQLEEHERASSTAPLLFSYSEGEFVEKCSMRLGREYRYLNGKPLWCAPFKMVSDSGVCRVFVHSRDGRPDQEYQVGVDIQRGKGPWRATRTVNFIARYQLENRTQYKLAYLQRHQLSEVESLHVTKVPTIMPGALLPFHWPRTDLDQLLCLRVVDIQDSQWSGGFILDKDSCFHLNIRSAYSYSAFVRCQVTLKGATYHVIFSDAASYPPPFRLENLSQTPITCCQAGVKSSLSLPLNPGQSVPYSWDEHTLPEYLNVSVKGGGELKVDLRSFGTKGKVYYESYFYIAAYFTFPEQEYVSFHAFPASSSSPYQRKGECSDMVLDVPQGTAVIFQKKDKDKRTQLWRMSASRQLVHIASSSGGINYVLDIAGGRFPLRGNFEPLVLRKASTLRAQSQTWRFSENGRLLMSRSQFLCVQSRSGYEALREGADAVLGHVTGSEGGGGKKTDSIPKEQEIRRMKHSPGSGVLSVLVVPDGPTRILRIVDENKKYSHTTPRDDWIVVENGQVAPSKSSDVDNCQEISWDFDEESDSPSMELEVAVVLEEGIGVSLINAVPEELIYATFRGIKIESVLSKDCQTLGGNVQHIQVDNKLAACHTPVLAYPTPMPEGETESSYPMLKLYVERVPYKSPFVLVFKVAETKLRDMTVNLEEKLLFKLLQWAGVGQSSQLIAADVESEMTNLLSYRTVIPTGSRNESLQLYFEFLNVASTELRISVSTTSQLPDDLRAIKHHLGFPLIKFESPVKLKGYEQSYMLGDVSVYADSLMKHYKKVIEGQAIMILGSVDFLGNPTGFFSDVASGVSGMISVQPDVVGLVRDVTHGMSDTTSKLTGTVSHMLGKATFDSNYQEEREQMLESCQTSGDHLKAGLMGLSSGVFGGMTSIITQPIEDARSYGFGGFFTGLVKGVVSTVAKPVAGILDLASETSAAIRESTSRVSRLHPPPVRHTRCCVGANGALTPFSVSQARGQEYLLRLTDGKTSEKLVSYELLYENHSGTERMRVIISSQSLYFFQQSPPDPNSLDNIINLDELAECKLTTSKTSIPTVVIVLSLIDKQSSYNAPKYKCINEKTAKKVAQLINYAKNLHEEERHIVRTFRLQQGSILW